MFNRYSPDPIALIIDTSEMMRFIVPSHTISPGRMVRNWHRSSSKYMPHQGKQEIARRLRQAERIAARSA